MITFFIGMAFSIAALAFAALNSHTAISNFVNVEGICIVIGGSFAIFLTANRSRVVSSVIRLLWRQVIGAGARQSREIAQGIINATLSLEKGQRPASTGNELLDLGLGWIDAGLDEKHIENLIMEYSNTKLSLMDEATNAVIHLGKYPPALGMVGTVFGIIGIFSGLGVAGASETIGPSLAVAMTATLYGLVISNFGIQPLGELLAQSVDVESRNMNVCAQALKLWHAKEPSFYIKEQMKLYEAA
ncbi:MAG TPA: MotA/TolQ/ExbB proton channel family protein [Bacteriovoracaceae bacterium]|nr:MotA/TolQ/ExbB proton channel family protein [Bacteriovoracaceae bacterium]